MPLNLILGRRGAQVRNIGFVKPVASNTGELITYAGDGHLMTFASTGTGKSSGPVICNALTHPGQLIVIDIKGEIYRETAEKRRAMGQEIHVLDLRDDPLPGSLNPFDLMELCGRDRAAIARTFAAELIERSPDERDRFWSDWSETMITGGTAWLLDDNEPSERKLSSLFDLFTNEDVDYKLAVLLDQKKVVNRAAKAAFTSYLQLSSHETRPSVLGSVLAHMRLFDNDVVRRVTDTSSMDVAALIAGKPMSLYIIVPPLMLHAFRPILRMWLSGLIFAMTQRQSQPEERTLMLCDEVGHLGKIDALLTASTLLRSFGLTIWTFWQNLAQVQIYGSQANTLIDNAGVIQIFGVRNVRMAQDLANVIGGISADQLMALRPDEQILLIESKIIKCKQARYYNDDLFRPGLKHLQLSLI